MKKISIALLMGGTITCGLCAGGGSSSQEEIQKSKIAQSETSEQTTSTLKERRQKKLALEELQKKLTPSRSSSSEYQIDSLFGPSSSTPIEDLSAGLIEESEIQRTTPTPNASVIYDNDNLLDQLLSDLEKEQQPKEPALKHHHHFQFEDVIKELKNNNSEFFKKYYKKFNYDHHRWIKLIAATQTNITAQKIDLKKAKKAFIKNDTTIEQAYDGLAQAFMIQQYIQSAQAQLAHKEAHERIAQLNQIVQSRYNFLEKIAQIRMSDDYNTK